ncbi:MAG TPA: glycosyltransferase family 9 protein [Pseudolabrys sp.]|nr:glycosyltransferase family 9 protein [Pseudolabrys sp.]
MKAAAIRILIISLRRIGDLLLTTPLIRSIRRASPDAKIDVLVFENTAGIITGNPDIDGIITMPQRPTALASLRIAARLWRRYDIAVSTQSGDRPTIFAFAAGRKRVGVTSEKEPLLARMWKQIALHRKVPAAEHLHRVEQMLQLADVLEVPRIAELVCPGAASFENCAGLNASYAVIHAAPMFAYKEWTIAGWRTIAAALEKRGLQIVAIGGPGESERSYLEEIWRGIADIRQLEWPQTLHLLNNARVYIGPDTSTTHLAAAAGCPTIALFGPMDPRVWGPWPIGGIKEGWSASAAIQNRGNVWIVQNPLPCVPCTFEGCERHIQSRSACLDELDPKQVLTAVEQALSRATSEH